MNESKTPFALLIILCAFMLSACQAMGVRKRMPPGHRVSAPQEQPSEAPTADEAEAKRSETADLVLDLRNLPNLADIIPELSRKRVVFVGESHANYGHHLSQLEIIRRLHEANPELFQFALGVLDVLTAEVPDRLLALMVLTKTLAHLGYRPQLLNCGVCGSAIGPGGGPVGFAPRHGGAVCRVCCGEEEARVPAGILRAVEEGIRTPLRKRGRLGLSAPEVRRAELLLERFFRFHVGVELKSTAFLRSTLGFEPVDADPNRGGAAPRQTERTGREPQNDRRV